MGDDCHWFEEWHIGYISFTTRNKCSEMLTGLQDQFTYEGVVERHTTCLVAKSF